MNHFVLAAAFAFAVPPLGSPIDMPPPDPQLCLEAPAQAEIIPAEPFMLESCYFAYCWQPSALPAPQDEDSDGTSSDDSWVRQRRFALCATI